MPASVIPILVFITVVSLILLATCIASIHRLQGELNEERWTRHKVFPLIVEVDHLDENQREYLDPEVVDGLREGELNIDTALALQRPTSNAPKRR
jgi:hypothetical protein